MSAMKSSKGTFSPVTIFCYCLFFFISVARKHTGTVSAHGDRGTEPPCGDSQTGTEYQRELAWGREEDG